MEEFVSALADRTDADRSNTMHMFPAAIIYCGLVGTQTSLKQAAFQCPLLRSNQTPDVALLAQLQPSILLTRGVERTATIRQQVGFIDCPQS